MATISSSTPSSQLVPVMKTMAHAATAPVHAKAANRRVGLVDRSTRAPTKTRTTAETIVDTVSVYGTSEPGETGMPSTLRLLRHTASEGRVGQAALLATTVRYGASRTVVVVVT